MRMAFATLVLVIYQGLFIDVIARSLYATGSKSIGIATALAGSARVSVEGAGTGGHHMPALPSKGKSRDLSVAALIPVSAYGVIKRLGSPDDEQHALLWFLSESGDGGRAADIVVRATGDVYPFEQLAS